MAVLPLPDLKNKIDTYIYSNNEKLIYGDIHNEILKDVLDSLNALDITVYNQDTQPDFSKSGTLWYKPSTKELYISTGVGWDLLDLSNSVFLDALDIPYDNSSGFLDATNVQDAIDELTEGGKSSPNATGLLSGGVLSINGTDPTQLDIQAGEGLIVDNFTTNDTVQTVVSWNDQTISLPNLNTSPITYVAIDINGNVYLQNIDFTREDIRDYIILGAAVHQSLLQIDFVVTDPVYLKAIRTTLNDLVVSIGGYINISGNEFLPNTGLTLKKEAGKIFGDSVNYSNSKKSPNVIDSPAIPSVTFTLVKSDAIVAPSLTDVPTDLYEPDGLGILEAIPTDYFVIHRVCFNPIGNIVAIQYGQKAYDSLKKALDSYDKTEYNLYPALDDTFCSTYIAVRQGITEFGTMLNYKFIQTGAFGDLNRTTIDCYSSFAEGIEILNGMSYQRQDITYIEDSGNLYVEVEREGMGDLTYVFGQSEHILNCTTNTGTNGKARALLTQGSPANPVENYIYVTTSGPGVAVLNASSTFPTGKFGWVGKVLIADAATFLVEGVYSSQRFTDAKAHNDRGALSYEREKLRTLGASYEDGVLPNLTINTVPNPDSVNLTTSQGEIYQLHRGTFRSFDISTDGIYVLNDPTTPWWKITDINELNTDSTGTNLAGSCFNAVIGGIYSSADGINYSKLFLLLPNGIYGINDRASAAADINNTSVTQVPKELKGTAFLIARITLRVTAQGAWENVTLTQSGVNFYDLRGTPLGGYSGGAGIPSVTTFTDDVFRVLNNIDTTKELAFDVSNVTTGTVRTLEIPNENGKILLDNQLADASLGGSLTIQGDLTVNGTTTTIDTETVQVKDNFIEVNYGETGAGVTAGSAGLEIDRGTLTNYQFLFDETADTFRVGEVGSSQAVATREDNPNNLGVSYWDGVNFIYVTNPNFVWYNDSLGVGEALPSEKLDVYGNIEFGDGLVVPTLYMNTTTASKKDVLKYDGGIVMQFADTDIFNIENESLESKFKITSTDKIEAERNVNTLTAASTVNIDFSNWNVENLTITEDTTINITGTYKTGDIVTFNCTGDYLLYFVQTDFTFKGKLDSNGVLINYNGLKDNFLKIECVDSSNKIFNIINSFEL